MWEQALNKATEVSTSDSILDNLQMEDSIEGEGGEDGISDFPARLGLKAGSTAQLWEASGLYNLKPEPVSKASEGLGLLRPASPGFTGFTGLITTNIMV